MTIDPAAQSFIHTLWDELADFDATQSEGVRRHLLARICELIDAQNGIWIGAVRLGDAQPADPVNGWRPRAIRRLHPNHRSDCTAKKYADRLEIGSAEETTVNNVAGAGRYRVNLLADLAPEGWFEGEHYRVLYSANGYRDAIWAGIPVNEDTEVYCGFYRGSGRPMFSAAERDIVAAALRGLKWLHRRLLLAEGIGVASTPLSPAERQVLNGLLRGLSEKKIAEASGHSPHTVHEYVRRIFRKYGVTSRAQLTALWLGKGM